MSAVVGSGDILGFLDVIHQMRERIRLWLAEELGLTPEQASLLCALHGAWGKATITRLAMELQRATHTISARVNGMEKANLVRRKQAAGDQRQVWVRPTANGVQQTRAVQALTQAWLAQRGVSASVQHARMCFAEVDALFKGLTGGKPAPEPLGMV